MFTRRPPIRPAALLAAACLCIPAAPAPAQDAAPHDWKGATLSHLAPRHARLQPTTPRPADGDPRQGQCVTCPPGSLIEPEPCGSDQNGGCNSMPVQTTPAACGDTICGTAWADAGTRDTDWYQFALLNGCVVEGRGRAEFPLRLFILDANCPPALIATAASAGACEDVVVTSPVLPEGTYRLFAGVDGFEGVPCGTALTDYTVMLACIKPPPPPPNDDCFNAFAVGEGTFDFTNVNASTDGPPACGLIGSDVWYLYTASSSGTATISTCGQTALDTVLDVYAAGPCPPPAASRIVCLDDFCGLQTEVSFQATAGTQYLVRLGGFNGQQGSGSFTIELELVGMSITSVTPLSGRVGDIITINGSGFGNNPDNLCSIVMNGQDFVPFRVLTATDTQITAVLRAVRPEAGPGPLMVARGKGSSGTFVPAFPDVIPEDPDGTWTWLTGGPEAAGPIFTPIFTPPPPPVRWFFGDLVDGRFCVFLDGNWMPNTYIRATLRIRCKDFSGFDEETFCIRFRGGGNALHCARRIADTLACAIFQRTGIVLNVNVIPVAPNVAKLEIIKKNEQGEPEPIVFGNLSICAEMPHKLFLPSGLFVTPFFNADIEPANPGVRAINIGSSGQDGVTVDLGENVRGVRVITDPIDLDFDRACLNVDAWGTWNGTPYLFLGGGSLWGQPVSCIDAFADFSAIAAQNVRVELFQDNQFQGSVVLPNGILGVVQAVPGDPRVPPIVGYGKLAPPDDAPPCIFFNFADVVRFTPNDGRPPLFGDELRMLAADSPGPIDAVTQIDAAAGFPAGVADSFVIRNAVPLGDPRPITITDIQPRTGRVGDIVTITGTGFGNNPDNICSLVRNGDNAIPFRVLTATDTQITAVLRAVRPDAQPGPIMVELGTGSVGTFVPAFPDVIPEDPDGAWIWLAGGPGAAGPVFTPVFTPPPPNIQWFHGNLVEGRFCVFLEGDWMPNTYIAATLRLRCQDNTGFDEETFCVRFRGGGNAIHCARRVADTLACAIFQRTGIRVNVNVIPFPPNVAKLEIIKKDEQGNPEPIAWGNLIVCAEMPHKLFLPSGLFVTPFFNADIEQTPDGGVRVINIGSSGEDGATIDLGLGQRGVRVTTDPIDLDFPRACLNIDAWGTWNGFPYLYLGGGSLWGRPESCLDAFGDFSAIGAKNVRVEMFLGDRFMGSATLPNGELGVVQAPPGIPRVPPCTGYGKLGPPFNPPCIWIDFDDPVVFTPLGGQPIRGDQMRMLAADSPAPINEITQIDAAVGFPQGVANSFTIRNAVLLDNVCPEQLSDTFEAYPLGPICPQGGWEPWPGQGDTCHSVSNAQSFSGTQSLRILAGLDAIGQGNDTLHRVNAVGGRWTFRVQTYVPVDATGRAFVILLNTFDDPPLSDNFSALVRLNADNNLVSNDFTGAVATLVRGRWAELRLEIDLDADSVDYFYDGQLFGQDSWTHGTGRPQIDAVDFFGDVPGVGTSGMFVDDAVVVPACPIAPPPCPPDWNGDGVINSNDYFDFLADFFGAGADYNGDGVTNSNDYFDFLADFFDPPEGCD